MRYFLSPFASRIQATMLNEWHRGHMSMMPMISPDIQKSVFINTHAIELQARKGKDAQKKLGKKGAAMKVDFLPSPAAIRITPRVNEALKLKYEKQDKVSIP